MIFPKICTLGLLRNITINEHVKTIKTENKEQEIINIVVFYMSEQRRLGISCKRMCSKSANQILIQMEQATPFMNKMEMKLFHK